ncbi:hypothetical protein DSL72_003039 [Monilinia vaccinii-corymbosi]|uniref:Uncharacterized protein n=1 Tax=Monilinia vaccinii-corymbosi TaxID=61207 RepID=A0A8A3P160_9HELO|nr:hypothetical protein DSL72_003039 [Monilinia vaccinii-corymbosi]
MHKFPKKFGRRKSTANALDNPEPPVESSFKVFERPQPGGHKSGPSFDGGVKFARAIGTDDAHKEDNLFEGMKVNTVNRGSGASNTNTASTADNSSRLSATSTAPSSMETPGQEDWKVPHDRYHSDAPPKTSSGFSLKNAGRTLSWGRNKTTPSPSKGPDELPPSPTLRDDSASSRTRAVTASSYASTATPPKLGERDLDLTMGDDFGDMFAGMAHRRSPVLDSPGIRGASKSPEIMPPEPALQSHATNRTNQPPPLILDKRKPVEDARYSWGSNDGLVKSGSPPPVATRNMQHMQQPPHQPPPVPRHGPLHQIDGNQAIPRPRSSAPRPDSALKRSSALSMRRQSALEFDGIDEDAALLRDSINASRHLGEAPSNPQARKSWALPSQAAYNSRVTAKTQLLGPDEDEDLFESADLAQQFQERGASPPPSRQTPVNKVMTPAQFERYRQDQERLRGVGGRLKDEEDEETYDDDEDEAEKSKNAAKQRRKQEAHMSVYRQQMMKVTGESTPPPGPPLPSMFNSMSTPNLVLGVATEDGEEEDEEVPLAILAAHGFPNKNRPPTSKLTSIGSNPNLRGAAQAVPGIGGPLPVFARNLPQDPYFGAGLVYPANRESLTFGNGGSGSINGTPARGAPPGGLVGVIATEERSRAMRRGSPSPGYGQMPPGGFTGMTPPPIMGQVPMGAGALGMGQMGLGAGAGALGMGQMGPGAMPQPMLSPGDQAQIRMTEQMQSFMQMQLQFMQMMATSQGQGNQPASGAPQLGPLGQLGPIGHMSQPNFGEIPRPMTQQLQTSNSGPDLRPQSAQRTMSMLEPSGMPWMQQHGQGYAPSIHAQGNGYAPSIAPSERSNIGLPGRYRPVSQIPVMDAVARTSTMSGALGGWESKHASTTIKTVQRVDNDDEDDEEGWAEMKKKREQKRSVWKSKKDTSGLSEMLGYAQ